LLAENREAHPDWPEETVRLMAESKKQLDQGMVDALMDKLNLGGSDWLNTIQDVRQPVMLLTANTELGAIVTPAMQARIHELQPSWEIVNFPDVGHLIRYDAFAAYIDALRRFLGRVAA
jgi:fermentation-respiration switch protein FrsA (DUF1100 family)